MTAVQWWGVLEYLVLGPKNESKQNCQWVNELYLNIKYLHWPLFLSTRSPDGGPKSEGWRSSTRWSIAEGSDLLAESHEGKWLTQLLRPRCFLSHPHVKWRVPDRCKSQPPWIPCHHAILIMMVCPLKL